MLEQLSRGAPIAAFILLTIVAVSGAGLSFAPQIVARSLFRPYWLARRQDYFTWISSGFVHATFAHLFFNALTFWSFGFNLERRIGSARFAILYIAGLLLSNVATYFKQRRNPDYASLGASGAILGVLFASIVYFPHSSLFILPIPFPIPAPLFALGYLAYTVYAARAEQGRINHDAHLSGALVGLLFVAITDPRALQTALRSFL